MYVKISIYTRRIILEHSWNLIGCIIITSLIRFVFPQFYLLGIFPHLRENPHALYKHNRSSLASIRAGKAASTMRKMGKSGCGGRRNGGGAKRGNGNCIHRGADNGKTAAPFNYEHQTSLNRRKKKGNSIAPDSKKISQSKPQPEFKVLALGRKKIREKCGYINRHCTCSTGFNAR